MADFITSKQLREERGPLAHKMQVLNDTAQNEHRVFTAEEEGTWKQLNEDYNLYTARIEMAERTEQVLAEQLAPVDSPKNEATNPAQSIGRENYDGRKALEQISNGQREQVTAADHAMSLQAWARSRDFGLTPSHERACRLTGINPHARDIVINFPENSHSMARRQFFNTALSGEAGVQGAFTKPEGFVQNLETALLAYAQLRQVAEVIRTSDGNPLPWPTVDNTSNTGYIVGENQSNTTEQIPTFGRYIWNAYQYTSGFVKIPNSFMTDSAFNLAAIAGEMQGEMIGRAQAADFTSGSGVNKPTGFVTACVANSATVTAASSTAIGSDDLFGLQHGIDPAYRSMGCTWMLHDTILLAIRKLKDGNGQYLWQPGLQVGVADRLLGDPLFINQSMDSTTASGTYSVAYGVFSKYKIRDVNGIVLRRVEERYVENDQTGFIAFLRSDGNLLDAGRKPIKLLKHT